MATYRPNGHGTSSLDYLNAGSNRDTPLCKLGKMLQSIPSKGDSKHPYIQGHLMQIKGLNNLRQLKEYLNILLKSGCVEKNGCGLEKTKKGKDLLLRLYELSVFLKSTT